MKQLIFSFGLLFVLSFGLNAQQEPWQDNQLMEADVLAQKINKNQLDNTLILSIGFDDVIAGSTYIGAGRDKASIEKLEKILLGVSKDTEVVIYCGCCPFDRCPNIRPAFEAVQNLGFKNAKLLNIPDNIKVDWLDKDYPTKE